VKRLLLLLPLVAACASDKYVHIEMLNGSRSLYAKRAEAERVDSQGMIDVENVLTGKRVTIKRSDCIIRSASRGEVTRARGNNFVYDQ